MQNGLECSEQKGFDGFHCHENGFQGIEDQGFEYPQQNPFDPPNHRMVFEERSLGRLNLSNIMLK